GGVERAFADLQHVLRHDAEAIRDAIAVERSGDERAEDEQVERAGQQVRSLVCESHMPNVQCRTSQSVLRTTSGSTRVAWCAGESPAITATPTTSAHAPANATGFIMLTRYNRPPCSPCTR